jgi:hypothetical protein
MSLFYLDLNGVSLSLEEIEKMPLFVFSLRPLSLEFCLFRSVEFYYFFRSGFDKFFDNNLSKNYSMSLFFAFCTCENCVLS